MKKTGNRKETVRLGRIGSPVGIRGEVRINLYAHDSDNLKEGKVLLFDVPEGAAKNGAVFDTPEGRGASIERVRYQKDKPVVKLKGIDDRNAAELLRGLEVSIREDDLEPLPEGEHYVRDLIGCRVVDIAGGGSKEIGVLKDVIQNTAQSVLDVETAEGKSVLIPAVDAFLRNIDEEGRLIEVELIPGFID